MHAGKEGGKKEWGPSYCRQVARKKKKKGGGRCSSSLSGQTERLFPGRRKEVGKKGGTKFHAVKKRWGNVKAAKLYRSCSDVHEPSKGKEEGRPPLSSLPK